MVKARRSRPRKAGKNLIGLWCTGDGLSLVDIFAPIIVVSEANLRGHWWSKDKRRREQRYAAAMVVRTYAPRLFLSNVTHVTLTRYGVRLLDTDNLAGAFKAVRDGIADALGVDDGTLPWQYDQLKSQSLGIRISLRNTSTNSSTP